MPVEFRRALRDMAKAREAAEAMAVAGE